MKSQTAVIISDLFFLKLISLFTLTKLLATDEMASNNLAKNRKLFQCART